MSAEQKYGRILFVINPVSGGIDKDEFIKLIESKAEKHHFHFEFIKTTSGTKKQDILDKTHDFGANKDRKSVV